MYCLFAAVATGLAFASTVLSHDGPDPVMQWRFVDSDFDKMILKARLGPDLKLPNGTRKITDDFGGACYFPGGTDRYIEVGTYQFLKDQLPVEHLTVCAWVSVDERTENGGIIGIVEDNGEFEKGWVLGFDKSVFTFGLASSGGDDGDGNLTYVKGATQYETGRYYHIAAVYDGELIQIYVNGKLDGTSDKQSSEILYPSDGSLVLAAYRDRNECYSFHGCIREISLYERAAKAEAIEHDFAHGKSLIDLRPTGAKSGSIDFVVEPYLQFGTQNSMTVMWQTTVQAETHVQFGETIDCASSVECTQKGNIHTGRIGGLAAETQYFYRTVSKTKDGDYLESDPKTFVTAVKDSTPFAFAVVGDTQGNPKVAARISEMAWAQRPSFAIHAGDLVDQGNRDSDWTTEFFPSMHELISRVPIYTVLGNHEQNASNYFDYMDLPEPEFYYDFIFANAQFFMIDSNRKVDPESEQYQWLEKKLQTSTKTWKFVCHHHPPYSSDEDDYGNLWKANKSTRGDTRIRSLVPLYERYGVDIVWNGHIHSYERTWPIRDGSAVVDGGTIYTITGGGGGNLETPGPIRPFFQNNVRRGHHYVMVYINGTSLEFKAFDLDDRLFDVMNIKKDSGN